MEQALEHQAEVEAEMHIEDVRSCRVAHQIQTAERAESSCQGCRGDEHESGDGDEGSGIEVAQKATEVW